ncbi:MAG: sigma-70 family RNA polymerase sigma factor [Nevskia sp.]|nr:sigma-70 family RNA polymerase sigma factor [Nevskia sp.]
MERVLSVANEAGQPGAGAAEGGGTVEELMPIVYQELRGIARRERRRLAGGETLATTALINEAYLRLVRNPAFASRASFLRIASIAMRRILVDRVRAQFAAKRGSGENALDIDEVQDFIVEDGETVLEVHEALQTLTTLNPRLVEIVECRFFAGYSEAQAAEALGVSERTVQRDWALARAWLKKELGR